MTCILILTRHAKSDWDDPALQDHDRPLNARGRADAPRIGQWVAQHARPGQALVSTARRAADTYAAMAAAFMPQPEPAFISGLYHASSDTMVDALRRATAQTVLMVGHNPGIAEFADLLLRRRPENPDFLRYPTAATLIAGFDIETWSDLSFGTGRTLQFTVPRSL